MAMDLKFFSMNKRFCLKKKRDEQEKKIAELQRQIDTMQVNSITFYSMPCHSKMMKVVILQVTMMQEKKNNQESMKALKNVIL